MNRDFLEDYERREREEYENLISKIQNGKFNFEKESYPSINRFVNPQKPLALASHESSSIENVYGQLPFCGTLIVSLPPFPPNLFEEYFFKISEIPRIVEFIKETGKLQITLQDYPLRYEGLDYWDPIFEELNPPVLRGIPFTTLGNSDDFARAEASFFTLGRIAYFDFLEKIARELKWSSGLKIVIERGLLTYAFLKLTHEETLAATIENLMVDNPSQVLGLLDACQKFIVGPFAELSANVIDFTAEELRTADDLPFVYQPEKISFPCEVGKFLLKKLTYAPLGLDACLELMHHYDAYDLRKVRESLNEGIVTNNPDLVNKNVREFSEILDNAWSDKTITRRIKGLQIGVPLSMAALGSVAAGPIGAVGGFLAGLGYNVADKLIDLGTGGLSERLAKSKTKSYQVNIYDFKKKYRDRMVLDSAETF